jgi:hypothetical protein
MTSSLERASMVWHAAAIWPRQVLRSQSSKAVTNAARSRSPRVFSAQACRWTPTPEYVSCLRDSVWGDLDLSRFGFEIILPEVTTATPWPDRNLVHYRDDRRKNAAEIARYLEG